MDLTKRKKMPLHSLLWPYLYIYALLMLEPSTGFYKVTEVSNYSTECARSFRRVLAHGVSCARARRFLCSVAVSHTESYPDGVQ